LYTNLLNSDY